MAGDVHLGLNRCVAPRRGTQARCVALAAPPSESLPAPASPASSSRARAAAVDSSGSGRGFQIDQAHGAADGLVHHGACQARQRRSRRAPTGASHRRALARQQVSRRIGGHEAAAGAGVSRLAGLYQRGRGGAARHLRLQQGRGIACRPTPCSPLKSTMPCSGPLKRVALSVRAWCDAAVSPAGAD